MKKISKRAKKTIILVLVLAIIFFIAFLLLISVIITAWKSKGTSFKFANVLKQIGFKNTWIAMLCTYVPLMCVIIFQAVKSIKGDTFNKVERSSSKIYGDADWISKKELNNLYGDNGSPWNSKDLSNYLGGYVFHSETKRGTFSFNSIRKQNGLVIGTAGTGKSLFFLSPTIQMIAKSKDKPTLIINDLKGELHKMNSATLAKNGYQVVVLDLRTPRKSLRYNPLEIIWDMYEEYLKQEDFEILDKVSALIKDVAKILIPIKNKNDPYWDESAQELLIGTMWAMLEDSLLNEEMTKDKFTILQFSNLINVQKSDLIGWFQNRPATSEVFKHIGFLIDNASEKTVSSIYGTAQAALANFLDTGIEYLTSGTDFDFSNINKKPTAIFIIIPDENKARHSLANLFITQFYNMLTFEASMQESGALARTTYFLMDEFGNMPKLENFNEWISVSRGRNIFFLIILQSISQLQTTFNHDISKTILQNLHIQVFLGANEIGTLEYFQKLLGTYTIYSKSKSINVKTILGETGSSISHGKKNLVELSELQYIKPGTAYVVFNREKPLKANLVPFFSKQMQDNNVFVKGSVVEEIKEKEISKADTFYFIGETDGKFENNGETKTITNKNHSRKFNLKNNGYVHLTERRKKK